MKCNAARSLLEAMLISPGVHVSLDILSDALGVFLPGEV